MTPREQVAYNLGIEAVVHAALTVAVTIETRHDAREVRHQAAVAALQGLAEGARGLMLGKGSEAAPEPILGPVGASTPDSREAAGAQGSLPAIHQASFEGGIQTAVELANMVADRVQEAATQDNPKTDAATGAIRAFADGLQALCDHKESDPVGYAVRAIAAQT